MKNRLIKNMMKVFSGTMVAGVLSLFNTSLLVKSVGLENNGIIFLGLAYAGFFNALFNFQSYEAVIKFLPAHMDYGNEKGKNYIQQAIVLDLITAIFAFLAAHLSINFAGKYFQWDERVISCIKILNFTIIFTLTGAFTGVLRIFDKFKEISYINIGKALINFIIYFIGWIKKYDLIYYIYGTVLSSFICSLFIMMLVYKVLKEKGMNRLNLFNTIFDKEFIKFNIFTNLSSTLDLPIFHLTPFIINKYLGLSDIAVYKILERIGSIFSIGVGTLGQVLMPEISKELNLGDVKKAKRIVKKVGILIGILGVMSIIFVNLTYKYWLENFIPNYSEYMIEIYSYLGFIIFTQSFLGQGLIFTFGGYLKYNIPILLGVNFGYLILLEPFVKNMRLEGIILLRVLQAGIIFFIKDCIMRRGDYCNSESSKANRKRLFKIFTTK